MKNFIIFGIVILTVTLADVAMADCSIKNERQDNSRTNASAIIGTCSNNGNSIACAKSDRYTWVCNGPSGSGINQNQNEAIKDACGCGQTIITIKNGAVVFKKRLGEDGIEYHLANKSIYSIHSAVASKLTSNINVKVLNYYKNKVAYIEIKTGYPKFKKSREVINGLKNGTYKIVPFIDNYYKVTDNQNIYYFRESDVKDSILKNNINDNKKTTRKQNIKSQRYSNLCEYLEEKHFLKKINAPSSYYSSSINTLSNARSFYNKEAITFEPNKIYQNIDNYWNGIPSDMSINQGIDHMSIVDYSSGRVYQLKIDIPFKKIKNSADIYKILIKKYPFLLEFSEFRNSPSEYGQHYNESSSKMKCGNFRVIILSVLYITPDYFGKYDDDTYNYLKKQLDKHNTSFVRIRIGLKK